MQRRNPNRWLAWAEALRGRYGIARPRGRLGPPLRFLRRRTPVRMQVERNLYFLRQLIEPRVAPALYLKLDAAPAGAGRTIHRETTRDRVAERFLRSERHAERLERLQQWTRRVESRWGRIESRVAATRWIVERRTAPAPPVSAAREEVVHHVDHRGMPVQWPTARESGPWPQTRATAPAVNVDHITEHVLRQLDRRISAWRERTGRI